MVHGSPLLRVRAGRLRMLSLNGYSRNMLLTCRDLFFRPWTRADPTIAAVEADTAHRGAVDHRGVVNVVNFSDVHVVHRTVVEKVSVVPTSTLVALAIETDVRAPVAIVEDISVAAPTPIGWSPEQTGFRSHHPCPRHPVVIVEVIGVSPVPRCPEITIAGTERLLVDGKFRRSEVDGYANLRKRCCRQGQHDEREQQRTNETNVHCVPLAR